LNFALPRLNPVSGSAHVTIFSFNFDLPHAVHDAGRAKLVTD